MAVFNPPLPLKSHLLALNQIGAISKWIDITAPEEDIKEAILSDNCRIICCFAVVIPKIEGILNNCNLEKIIYVEPKQFIRKKCFLAGGKALIELEGIKKQSLKNDLPSMPKREPYISFIDFIKTGSKDFYECVKYQRNEPALKIQSSGTTGKPKVIVHTDYSINSSIAKNAGIDLPLYEKKVLLKIAPSWVGYGLINSFAMPLAFGMEVLTTPSFEADLLIKMNGKYDITLAVPFLYRYLAEHIDEIDSMERPLALVSGGDKITKNEIESIQKIIQKKGCTAPILNGAGCNEIVGSGVVNPVLANRPGSVGIPLWNDIASVFDPETGKELDIGEKGEICYQTSSAFLEYDRNPVQTSDIKVMHSDGKVWIHTKDLGYQDEDGFLYIEGRMTRVITVGGFKISANSIEDALDDCEYIKECVAVAAPDKEFAEVPMLFVVLADGISETEVDSKLKCLCEERIKGRALPKYYNYIEKIPYTSNNKQDYRALEKIASEYVSNRK